MIVMGAYGSIRSSQLTRGAWTMWSRCCTIAIQIVFLLIAMGALGDTGVSGDLDLHQPPGQCGGVLREIRVAGIAGPRHQAGAYCGNPVPAPFF